MALLTRQQWERVVTHLRSKGITDFTNIPGTELKAHIQEALPQSEWPTPAYSNYYSPTSAKNYLLGAAKRAFDPEGFAREEAARKQRLLSNLEAGRTRKKSGEKRPAKAASKPLKWTAAEMNLLATELFKRNSNLLYSTKLSTLTCKDIEEACKILPTHRRRTGVFRIDRRAFVAAFAKLRKQLKEMKEESTSAEMKPVAALPSIKQEPIPAEIPSSTVTNEVTPPAGINPAISSTLDEMVSLFAARLGGVFAESFIEAFASKLDDAMKATIPALVTQGLLNSIKGKADLHTPPPPRPGRRPVVAIVGALPDQIEYLRKSCTDVEIKCIPKDLPNQQIAARLQDADKVLSLTKFISHPTDHAVKAAAHERYVPISGAAAEAKRYINDVFLRQAAIH